MSDQNNEMRATAREWRLAMFVVIGGFAIAIAVAVYFALKPAPVIQPPVSQTATLTPEQRRARAIQIGKVLCDAEILNAKSIGVLPNYGKGEGLPMRTDKPGRYVCIASTGVAKYAVAADVVCSTLLDPRCVNIYSVTSDDGTVLFKRPDAKPAPAK
jgi:hypothetical protein